MIKNLKPYGPILHKKGGVKQFFEKTLGYIIFFTSSPRLKYMCHFLTGLKLTHLFQTCLFEYECGKMTPFYIDKGGQFAHAY